MLSRRLSIVIFFASVSLGLSVRSKRPNKDNRARLMDYSKCLRDFLVLGRPTKREWFTESFIKYHTKLFLYQLNTQFQLNFFPLSKLSDTVEIDIIRIRFPSTLFCPSLYFFEALFKNLPCEKRSKPEKNVIK